jgi:D-alanyl-D-alanine endopeptidase (penicillin-binding protein 7)
MRKVTMADVDPGASGALFGFGPGHRPNTGQALLEKHSDAVVPIASISKLMTAMVVLDAKLDLQEVIAIGDEDVDGLKGTRSRLPVGTTMTRETAMLLALMSSENRAAHALGRHYPGGMPAFVQAMNRKAQALGMSIPASKSRPACPATTCRPPMTWRAWWLRRRAIRKSALSRRPAKPRSN